MAIGGEAAHVEPDLGEDYLRIQSFDARCRGQLPDCGTKGRNVCLHLLIDRDDSCLECVDLLEM